MKHMKQKKIGIVVRPAVQGKRVAIVLKQRAPEFKPKGRKNKYA